MFKLLTNTSTGNVRPGMVYTGTFPKKSANFCESIVAEVTISFRSLRRLMTDLKIPNKTSVLSDRS